MKFHAHCHFCHAPIVDCENADDLHRVAVPVLQPGPHPGSAVVVEYWVPICAGCYGQRKANTEELERRKAASKLIVPGIHAVPDNGRPPS